MNKICSMLMLCFLSCGVFADNIHIKNLEPLNWWVGMQHQQLQLMVHAENIAQTTPIIDYAGVSIVNTETTDNRNYLFINLNISPSTKAGSFVMAFTQAGKVVAHVKYSLQERAKNSANRQGFSARDAIYLIVPDRFANGNPANDSQNDVLEKADRSNNGGRHGGDLKGMQEHLDYIANMGFTMVWPTPLLENNQEHY